MVVGAPTLRGDPWLFSLVRIPRITVALPVFEETLLMASLELCRLRGGLVYFISIVTCFSMCLELHSSFVLMGTCDFLLLDMSGVSLLSSDLQVAFVVPLVCLVAK